MSKVTKQFCCVRNSLFKVLIKFSKFLNKIVGNCSESQPRHRFQIFLNLLSGVRFRTTFLYTYHRRLALFSRQSQETAYNCASVTVYTLVVDRLTVHGAGRIKWHLTYSYINYKQKIRIPFRLGVILSSRRAEKWPETKLTRTMPHHDEHTGRIHYSGIGSFLRMFRKLRPSSGDMFREKLLGIVPSTAN